MKKHTLALLTLLYSIPLLANQSPILWGHEVRVGVLQHDTTVDLGHRFETGQDINVEYLFPTPQWEFLEYILSPRPHIGASINTRGSTSQVYAGLTWHWDFYAPFFVEGFFGGEVNNGKTNTTTSRKNSLGSNVMFREGLSLGFVFMDQHSLSVMLDHTSNACLARHNPGITNLGVRYGFLFN